jgi:hypothetical protein
MTGAIITFLLVCAIVATYMFIVHSFLRAEEEPEDEARADREREARARKSRESGGARPSRRPEWAH